MIAAPVAVFSYRESDHSYWLGDDRIRGISELLELGGYNKASAFYTQAGRDRGTDVHALLADIDMGVVDGTEPHPHRSYALGYLDIRRRLKPEWDGVEIALCSRGYRFGGRPDRIGTALGRKTVAEIKSGARNNERDGLQLALQSILAEEALRLRRHEGHHAIELRRDL